MRETIDQVKAALDGFIEQRDRIAAMPHSSKEAKAYRLVNISIKLCESMLTLLDEWEEEPCEKS